MQTPESPNPATPQRGADANRHPTQGRASPEGGAALPRRDWQGEALDAVCEAERERRAKRQGLLLMGASAILMLTLLACAWLLFRHLHSGPAG